MEIRTFVAYLVDKLGIVQGYKAFQKLTYMAKAMGIPLNCSFEMHYYGPYSDDLIEKLEILYEEDVIDLIENSDHRYKPGTKTKDTLKDGQQDIVENKPPLETLLQKFGKKSNRELELYSSIHLVWKIQKMFNWPTDREHVLEESKKAKYSKFKVKEIERAYNELVDWGLLEEKGKAVPS